MTEHLAVFPELMFDTLPETLRGKTRTLWRQIEILSNPILAFSGGVDSSLVAAVLARTHGKRCLLVTAESPSLALRQRQVAQRVARELGLPHRWLVTEEMSDPRYQQNAADRCFYCKTHLYAALDRIASEYPEANILSGTNGDDLSDHRPGLQAARDRGVLAPLARAGFTKADVRQVARCLGLSVHDLPAAPCLASRIAYGVQVSPERLRKVEAAEALLWAAGFSDVRVRLLPDEVARIEVPQPEVARLLPMAEESLKLVLRSIQDLGFHAVTVDPEGFRSGKLNESLTAALPKLPIL